MSMGESTFSQSLWKIQPFKGLLFIALIGVISWIFEILLGQIFRLNVASKLIYITIFFVWWWHLGFSLNGYPGNRFFSTRFGRGTINLTVLLVLSYLTGEVWKFISTKATLADTSAGLWGQTAIIAAATSLFFFDNTIVTTAKIRHWQPVSGFLNIFLRSSLLPLRLSFCLNSGDCNRFTFPGIGIPLQPSLAVSLNAGP